MGKWLKEQGPVEDRCRISGIGPFPVHRGDKHMPGSLGSEAVGVNMSHVAVGEWVHRYSQGGGSESSVAPRSSVDTG